MCIIAIKQSPLRHRVGGSVTFFCDLSDYTPHCKGSYFVPPHTCTQSATSCSAEYSHHSNTDGRIDRTFFQVLFVAILRSSESCSNTCTICVRGGRCLHNIVTHAYVRYALGSRPEKKHAHFIPAHAQFFLIFVNWSPHVRIFVYATSFA